MKNLKYLVLLLTLYCVPVKAQKNCVPLPDSLGKVLASVFLNKEDLAKTPIFPNPKEMEQVEKIEGFSSPIAVTATAAGTSKPFNEIQESWKMLLQLAQIKNIGAVNSKYSKTYFRINHVEIDNKKENHYELYVVFKQTAQHIAIKFDLLWRDNKWLLINVDHDFYSYVTKTETKSAFRAKGWGETLTPTAKAIRFSAPGLQRKQEWAAQPVCMTDPVPFINKTVQDLAAQMPTSKFSSLISAEDFKKVYLPDLEAMINQAAKRAKSMSASERKELSAAQQMIKEHPDGLYKEYVTNDVSRLTEYLASVKFKAGDVDSIAYDIANFDYQIWSPGKIIMKVDVTIKTTAGEEGILFRAGWHDDHWQVISMQSSTYGISKAE